MSRENRHVWTSLLTIETLSGPTWQCVPTVNQLPSFLSMSFLDLSCHSLPTTHHRSPSFFSFWSKPSALTQFSCLLITIFPFFQTRQLFHRHGDLFLTTSPSHPHWVPPLPSQLLPHFFPFEFSHIFHLLLRSNWYLPANLPALYLRNKARWLLWMRALFSNQHPPLVRVPCLLFFPFLHLPMQSQSAVLYCRLHCSLNPVRFATIYDLILKFDLGNGWEN
jgi:hypothetical protein